MVTVTTEADEPRRLMFRVAVVAGTLQVLWTVVTLGALDEWSAILFQSVGVAALSLVLVAVRRLREIGLGLALGILVGVALTWGLISAWIIIGNFF